MLHKFEKKIKLKIMITKIISRLNMSCASWELVNSEETVFSKPGIFTHLAYPYNGRRKGFDYTLVQFEVLRVSSQFINVRILEESVKRLNLPEECTQVRKRKLKEKGYIYFKWDLKDTGMFPRIAEDSCIIDCEFPEGMDFQFLDWSDYPEDWKDKILK